MKTKKLILPLLALSLMTPALVNADALPNEPTAPTVIAADKPVVPMSLYTVKLKVNDPMLNNNGRMVKMDTKPMLWKGMVYVPLRALAEGVGAKVAWNAADGSTIVWAGTYKMKFWVGRNAMEINDAKISMGSKVMLNEDGRVMVPLRFVADQLGWQLDYSELDWSVTLTKLVSQS
ncbi:copper amine oxidase N-terminal domain-containing protein [Paenibacillus rhizovicinus]|uniref:Copper amine oxidase N-terminal domain-containing protein n=1 Tax=Paenibacillus rhizovicinus TaxID=2704463 RepID=A0A6C0P5Q2_9BACL|nr:copper amine oxidase N-terminal domain-containing protein [Paenibacillus rhizovicinus]QHW33043.1 copper amine oxidase N-terminal domain-containing protein [Paenibacillus rhizovicinus]